MKTKTFSLALAATLSALLGMVLFQGNYLGAPDGNRTNALVVNNDGRTGIGTTTPIARLQIGDEPFVFGKTEPSAEAYLPLIQHKSLLDPGFGNDLVPGARGTQKLAQMVTLDVRPATLENLMAQVASAPDDTAQEHTVNSQLSTSSDEIR